MEVHFFDITSVVSDILTVVDMHSLLYKGLFCCMDKNNNFYGNHCQVYWVVNIIIVQIACAMRLCQIV